MSKFGTKYINLRIENVLTVVSLPEGSIGTTNPVQAKDRGGWELGNMSF